MLFMHSPSGIEKNAVQTCILWWCLKLFERKKNVCIMLECSSWVFTAIRVHRVMFTCCEVHLYWFGRECCYPIWWMVFWKVYRQRWFNDEYVQHKIPKHIIENEHTTGTRLKPLYIGGNDGFILSVGLSYWECSGVLSNGFNGLCIYTAA